MHPMTSGHPFAAAALAFVVSLTVTEAGLAQSPIPLAVEARAHAAFPTVDLGTHARTGFGYGVSATVQLFPNYGLYGGWSRTEFDLEQQGGRAIDSGFAIGLTAAYPMLLVGGLTPWLGSGLLIHRLEVTGASVPAGNASLGFEFGGGVAIPLTPTVRLTPGLGYRWYNAPFIGRGSARISYLSAGAGLNVSF
jgi:hypothetical protein